MGNSHFTSNVLGHVGINVASVTATLISAGTSITGPAVTSTGLLQAGTYLSMGGSAYIFVGGSNAEASIIAEASALVGTTRAGSLYMSTKGALWLFNGDSSASPVNW